MRRDISRDRGRRRGPRRERPRRRRRCRAGRDDGGGSARRSGRHRGDRQRRSVFHDQREGPDHRSDDRGAVPRRRLRQEGRPPVHDRPARVSGAARTDRGQPPAGQSLAEPGGGSAGARCRQRRVRAGDIGPPGHADGARHHLEGSGPASERRGGFQCGDGESRQGLDRERPGAGRLNRGCRQQCEGGAHLHDHPVTAGRAHGQPRREGRQSRHSQHHRADDDRADPARVRHLLRAGRAPADDQAAHGRRSAGGERVAAGSRGATCDRPAHVLRQRRRSDHRHDQVESDLRQRRSLAMAGAILAGHAASLDTVAGGRGPGTGGADRPGWPVRVRREAGFERRAAADHERPARERGRRDRQGPPVGRNSRHGGAIAARAGNGGVDGARREPGRAGGVAVPQAVRERLRHQDRVRARVGEHLRDLHQTSDRHEPADGGHRALRRGRVPRAADQRSAAGRLPDDQRPGVAARRRSR